MSDAAPPAVRARGGRAVPWITLGFVAAALVASASAPLRAGLVFDRAALARGDWWRFLTGHLVHSWPALAAFDLGAILLLGAWIERRSRTAVGTAMLASTTAASLVVWCARRDLATYQGASAVACALYTLVCTRLLLGGPSPWTRGIAAVALGLFVAKTWSELASGGSSVVPFYEGPAGVEVVGLAHATGGVVGVAVGCALREQMRAAPPRVARGGAALD